MKWNREAKAVTVVCLAFSLLVAALGFVNVPLLGFRLPINMVPAPSPSNVPQSYGCSAMQCVPMENPAMPCFPTGEDPNPGCFYYDCTSAGCMPFPGNGPSRCNPNDPGNDCVHLGCNLVSDQCSLFLGESPDECSSRDPNACFHYKCVQGMCERRTGIPDPSLPDCSGENSDCGISVCNNETRQCEFTDNPAPDAQPCESWADCAFSTPVSRCTDFHCVSCNEGSCDLSGGLCIDQWSCIPHHMACQGRSCVTVANDRLPDGSYVRLQEDECISEYSCVPHTCRSGYCVEAGEGVMVPREERCYDDTQCGANRCDPDGLCLRVSKNANEDSPPGEECGLENTTEGCIRVCSSGRCQLKVGELTDEDVICTSDQYCSNGRWVCSGEQCIFDTTITDPNRASECTEYGNECAAESHLECGYGPGNETFIGCWSRPGPLPYGATSCESANDCLKSVCSPEGICQVSPELGPPHECDVDSQCVPALGTPTGTPSVMPTEEPQTPVSSFSSSSEWSTSSISSAYSSIPPAYPTATESSSSEGPLPTPTQEGSSSSSSSEPPSLATPTPPNSLSSWSESSYSIPTSSDSSVSSATWTIAPSPSLSPTLQVTATPLPEPTLIPRATATSGGKVTPTVPPQNTSASPVPTYLPKDPPKPKLTSRAQKTKQAKAQKTRRAENKTKKSPRPRSTRRARSNRHKAK